MGDDIQSIFREHIRQMTDIEIIQRLETCWDRTEEALLLDEIKNRKPNIFATTEDLHQWYRREFKI